MATTVKLHQYLFLIEYNLVFALQHFYHDLQLLYFLFYSTNLKVVKNLAICSNVVIK